MKHLDLSITDENNQCIGKEIALIEEANAVDSIIGAVTHNKFRALGLDAIDKIFKAVPQAEEVFCECKGLYKIDDDAKPMGLLIGAHNI